MQKGRIIDEMLGIVHAAPGCGMPHSEGQTALDIFLCKFVEHVRIVDVAN